MNLLSRLPSAVHRYDKFKQWTSGIIVSRYAFFAVTSCVECNKRGLERGGKGVSAVFGYVGVFQRSQAS
ncbi:MAG TPA: hypothetical protein DHV39_01945 [Verrucomicrobiales bacterium]|nr:hypothetical protein [Verrucomicrobiales bacterium]HCZ02162.1 hypothetical protein [Verrucomicrobiales bacterium]